ncbi:7-deoxyloganetin glucosyltransferase-like isoform X1 [Dendrobium catenatum]|uniref:7-deoxyloganetin glucosyltransferase-like isoform X1 n=1 Tax=Dendrobium catenatum TaxID=906689 RepID=UPI0009F36253|nr:7-deoxyloganetin glucosyltransferase-like isoform X1 [Dendrobium catenatum]
MVSSSSEPVKTPHAVLLSFPAQGHLNPILTLAKILHIVGGFRITIVNTEFDHRRLLRSSSSAATAANNAIDGFHLTSIPDGLPPNPVDDNATQDIPALCTSIRQKCPAFFRHLLSTLSPPATCVIADGLMSSSAAVAMKLGIPAWLFYTHSSCGFWSYMNFAELVRRGYLPLKDETFLTNGYLDTKIEVITGMEGIRLQDLPTFIRTTNPDDLMLQIMLKRPEDASCGVGIILNTFDALEPDVLAAVRYKFGNLYSIGPLTKFKSLFVTDSEAATIGSSLWKNDSGCLNWLDGQEQEKVVYVNFGSITVLSPQQLAEFAWGLAGSGYPILWAIRPDMVSSGGAAEALPENFVKQVEERTKVVAWCDQEAVLAHPAIGVFLTHCGWNSTLESLCNGVPMVCWPFFAEQPTNCRYICEEWGVGLEIEGEVKREMVAKLVREAMEGEKGMEMKRRALEWKEKARRATEPGGSSYANVEKLTRDLVQTKVSEAEIISTGFHHQTNEKLVQ